MAKCAWRQGCTSEASDNRPGLCDEHFIEMKARRKAKVESWQASAMESNKARYEISQALHSAYQSGMEALLEMAAEDGTYHGTKSVIVGHARTNSVFYNFVTGNVKSSQIPVAGWTTAPFVKGTINTPVEGLSLKAARVFADAYNNSLTESGIDDTTAIVA